MLSFKITPDMLLKVHNKMRRRITPFGVHLGHNWVIQQTKIAADWSLLCDLTNR